MASEQNTVDYIAKQIKNVGAIRYRKMFGEYAIYLNDKVIGFVCDNQLFIKTTVAGKPLLKEHLEAPAYPGSKNYFLIPEDYWDDSEYLSQLALVTYKEIFKI